MLLNTYKKVMDLFESGNGYRGCIGVEGREDHDGADQGIGEYGDY